MTDGDVHKVKFKLGINMATCAFTNENSFTLIEQRLLFSSVSVSMCEHVGVGVFACNCACVCMCMCMCMSASAILDTQREREHMHYLQLVLALLSVQSPPLPPTQKSSQLVYGWLKLHGNKFYLIGKSLLNYCIVTFVYITQTVVGNANQKKQSR